MNKFKSKKGFTLAELLIVVAIIAVLVAIAVPLFVSGLQKAQDARDNANIHAVKSAATVLILNTDENTGEKDTPKVTIYKAATETTPKTLFKFFTVTATINKNGDITISEIAGADTDPRSDAVKDKAEPEGDGWKITAYLSSLDLTITHGE